MTGRESLPIDDVLGDVAAGGPTVIVEAPPGAGKTTRVPPALARAVDGRVVVLEPRRVAARAAARRMASEHGSRVGEVVGVTTRDDRRTSRATRIEVVTEGVLVRRLQRDPGLDGVAAVVLDEFHERSLDADLALAFCREVQQLRDDLRLVVMSATLDQRRLAELLPDATVVASAGRLFDVEVRHRPRRGRDLASAVADGVAEALAATAGNVLVFVPGWRWIRDAIAAIDAANGIEVLALHGSMAAHEQDRVLGPPAPGTRRVVVATDVAESSLTVPGVTAVVDAGLARQPQVHPGTGLTRLVNVPTSRASAAQRAGRAGRLGPGLAIRLHDAAHHRRAQPTPAIEQVDLSGMALEVAAWGGRVQAVDGLVLVDPPPADAWATAVATLHGLSALDADGRITDHGRRLLRVPADPRIAHVLVTAARHGQVDGVAHAVAAVTERDPLRGRADADLSLRARRLPGAGSRQHAREAQRLARAVRGISADRPEASLGAILASGFPDRIAVRRRRGHFTLSSGRGARLADSDTLADEDLLVALDVADGGRDARIHLAAGLDRDELADVAAAQLVTTTAARFDADRGDVVAERTTRLGAVVLERAPARVGLPERHAALVAGIRHVGIACLRLAPVDRRLQARVAWVRSAGHHDWPALDDDSLLAELDEWLVPFMGTAERMADLREVPVRQALHHRLGRRRLAELDRLAPERITVPSGRSVAIDWDDERGPAVRVKLQEVFGTSTTPSVAGRPLVVILESPAQRPLAITRDLANFWEQAYPHVRAENRGRYPKHPWPEDPLTATPTRRTKR